MKALLAGLPVALALLAAGATAHAEPLLQHALERGSLLPAGPADAGLRLSEEPCEVAWEGQSAALTATEQRLLETFLGNVDETLSKPFLYQHVLNRGYTAHDRGLDMHVSHLRRKLQSIGYARHQLRAVWGKGYVFASAE